MYCAFELNAHPVTQKESPFPNIPLFRSFYVSPLYFLLLSYSSRVTAFSGDGVYMFSTHDEPEIKEDASPSLPSLVPSTVCFVLDSVYIKSDNTA